jgi:cobalt-zinc-cadmium efflux system membrane fusion protein
MRSWLIAVGMAAGVQAGASELVVLDGSQQARAGIVVRPVAEGSFADRQRVVGQVVQSPGSTMMLKSIVSGRIEEIRVAPGDVVGAGAIVAVLHSHDVLAMQGDLLRAAERSALAGKRVEAGRELLAVEGISQLDLELREQEAFSAKLDFDTTYEELLDHGLPKEALDRMLEMKSPDAHLPITAPAGGVVLELAAQRHEWVQEYAPLMVLGNPDRIELELQIAPDRAAGVAAGDVVEFAPVGRPAAAGRAEVVTRVPQVDPDTRTMRIRARIISADAPLYPGVFVEGTLVRGSARRAPAVPRSAVIGVNGRDSVFVRRGPDTFELRAVELGQSDEASYEITAGLAFAEEVAVEGVFSLKSALIKGAEGGE